MFRKYSLIRSILFFALGIILFINPASVVKFISYFIGGILIIVGIYKVINYYIHDKNLGVVNRNEIAFGITAVILGVIFIFLADAIELILRFIIGIWVVLAGINKIIQTFYTTDRDTKYYSLFIVGLFLIAIGLYIILVSNLALSIIGVFVILYSLIEIVSYFVYRDKEVIISENEVIINDDNVIEATVVDEKKEKKKSNKDKKEKKSKK